MLLGVGVGERRDIFKKNLANYYLIWLMINLLTKQNLHQKVEQECEWRSQVKSYIDERSNDHNHKLPLNTFTSVTFCT